MARRPSIDWLDFALRVLAEHGPAALVPEALTGRAGLTRGAFYHRFSSVDAFQSELLERWRQINTDAVIEAANRIAGGKDRQRALSNAAAAIDHALDRAIRAWSQHDDRARAAVAAVDEVRIAYIRDCIAANVPDRDWTARAVYLVYVGAQHVHPELDGTRLQALTDPIDQALLHALGKKRK